MKKIILLFTLIFTFILSSCGKEDKAIVKEPNISNSNISTSLTESVNNSLKSCVAIKTGSSLGSGVIVYEDDNNFYIATAYHVVKSSKSIDCILNDFSSISVSLIGYDDDKDIAILKMSKDSSNNYLISLNITNEIIVALPGNEVYAIGCPFSLDYYNNVTLGMISKCKNYYFYHSSYIAPGNSGGALFLTDGTFLGINLTRIYDTTDDEALNQLAKCASSYYIYKVLYDSEVISDEKNN